MSLNSCVLPLSHLEDACGHLFFFFFNFAFQTSHFLCLCIKRNRWWKPQGRKANKIQPPSTWPSNSHRFSNGTERGPGRASGQTRAEHSVRSPVPPGRMRSWTPSPSGPSPPHPHCFGHFHANCVFSPQSKVLTVLYLTKYPVLWFKRPVSFCLTKYTKTFLSQDHWTSTYKEHQGLAQGNIHLGRNLLGVCTAGKAASGKDATAPHKGCLKN